MSRSRVWWIVFGVAALAACESGPGPVGPDRAGVEVAPATITVSVGSTAHLVATVRNAQGEPTGLSVSWSSSDESIASVDEGGVVTGLEPGPALITASAGGHSGSAEVTVFGVTTSDLPGAVVGEAYLASLHAFGGPGAYSWHLASGSFPPGLEMAADGTISGVPTQAGPFTFRVGARSDGHEASRDILLVVFHDAALRDFLASLEFMIWTSLEANRESLGRNPHLAEPLELKITLLSDPGLAHRILAEGYYAETTVESTDGRAVPSMIAFPADSMRTGALLDLQRSGSAIGVLEQFLDVPWPADWVRNWYGFRIGNSGGGGQLHMEDRGTYAARGGGTQFVLHDAILAHELAHSYIGHEWLTQFLHLYVHNLLETGSEDVSDWTYFNLDTYEPFKSDNGRWMALLDIYQLMGPIFMGEAYRELHLMGVPYGSALSEAAQRAFVDRAPVAVRDRVADLVQRIG